MSFEARQKRFTSAEKRKETFKDTYQDAMKFAAQHRETFDYHTPGEKKYDRIFDSTGQSCLAKFVSNLQSGLVPPYKKWTKLIPGAQIPEANKDEAAKQLDKITDEMFMYLHSSNFDMRVSESFYDLGFGTGALLCNEGGDDHPFNFLSVPLAEIFLEEGPFGVVKTVYRRFKMPMRNIKPTWENAKMPKDYNEEKNADEEVELLESTIFDYDTGKYKYTIDCIKTKEELLDEEMESSPWIIFRWTVMPGEVYGRGPLLDALADIKTLNKAIELLLKASALKVVPTFIAADDGVINPYNIVIESGAVIPAAPFGAGGPPIVPLAVGGDINLSQLIIEKMQSRIEDMLFTNPLGDVTLPVKSATEMSLRAQELSNRIGSSYGRLNIEFIGQLVPRLLYILEKKGLLSISLKDVKVDGKIIKISSQAPLAQAQNEEEIANAIRYVQTIQQTFGPQALPLFVNLQGFSKMLTQKLNVSSDLWPTEEQQKMALQLISQVGNMMLQQNTAPPAQQKAA